MSRVAAGNKRKRKLWSVQAELLCKSREAALAAVQLFNNPQMQFKSELFIVGMNIAWTYLMHAHYRKQRIDYRYFQQRGQRRLYDRTKRGAYKYWELERCISDHVSPIDRDTANNLRFLIGIRHEIEHQMTTRIDTALSAKFQACCLNYNHYVKKLFGDKYGIDKHLAFSLQFSAITDDQVRSARQYDDLPENISRFIRDFEVTLSEAEYASPLFAYRVLFLPMTANRRGQADEVIEFVKFDSEIGQQLGKSYRVIKETERPKFLPGDIVKAMREEGHVWFNMQHHTTLWHEKQAKDPAKGLGVQVAKQWYWYEPWLKQVRDYCSEQTRE